MTFEDAVAAVEGAIADEAAAEAATPSLFAPPAPATPDQAATPSAPQGESAPTSAAPQTPAAPVAPETPAAPVDTFDDGVFNPDTLPPELQPAWKQLQAAFVQKTQKVAEERKQLETLGSVEELQSAHQLYRHFQNPENWPQLGRELNDLMVQRGMSPATPLPAAPATPALDTAVLDELSEYPELAPLAQQMRQLQEQVSAMSGGFAAEREAFQREQAEAAAAGEFMRQESVLLAQGRSEADMTRIHKLSTAHGGNLIAAAQDFDAMKREVLKEYVDSKQDAARSPLAPIGGGSSDSVVPPAKPATLEEATDIAMERLRAAGLDTLDF